MYLIVYHWPEIKSSVDKALWNNMKGPRKPNCIAISYHLGIASARHFSTPDERTSLSFEGCY